MLDAETDTALDSDSESRNALLLWLHLYKCSKQLEQEMSDRFREKYGSSFSRFDVMAHLHEAGSEGLSTSVLAAQLLASKGNITRLLDRMEEDGLIERKLSTEDRRVSRIYLSPAGAAAFEQMTADHEAWAFELFDGISGSEKRELLRLITRITKRRT